MGQFSDWKEEATRPRKDVTICFDRALLSRIEDLEVELDEIKADPDSKMLGDRAERIQGIEAEIEGLRTAAKAKSRKLTFEGLGRERWRNLVAANPPTQEQLEELGGRGRMLDFNPETFPAIAVHASCVEPEGFTLEDSKWLFAEMPLAVVDRVWAACLEVNVTGAKDPFVQASDEARVTVER